MSGMVCPVIPLHKATQIYKALAVSSPNRTKLGIPWVRLDWPTCPCTPVTLLESMKSCAGGSVVVACSFRTNTFLLCTVLTSTLTSQSQQSLCEHRCEVGRNPAYTAARWGSPQVPAWSCFCGPRSQGDALVGSRGRRSRWQHLPFVIPFAVWEHVISWVNSMHESQQGRN